MELSKTVEDKTFDDYFTEVKHSETITGMLRPGSLRLFASTSGAATSDHPTLRNSPCSTSGATFSHGQSRRTSVMQEIWIP